MKKKSKRYKSLKETYKKKELKKFEQILNELKNGSGVKFDESIDISMKINLKKIKGSDNNLRTLIDLPHGYGKKGRVGLLCDENKLDEAKKSGADVVGSEDLLKKISDKNINQKCQTKHIRLKSKLTFYPNIFIKMADKKVK